MWNEITGKANKTFKYVKSLGQKNYRDKNKTFLIEGYRLVNDALKSGARIHMVAVNDEFLKRHESNSVLDILARRKVDIYKFPMQMFKEISYTENSQGIIAVVGMEPFTMTNLKMTEAPFYVFCDNVQDPGNLGTIIRTADAAGVEAVLLSKGCVDIYNPKTVRSTMGALFHLPVIKIEDTLQTLSYLKEKKLNVISGYLDASKYHFDIDMRGGIVIVIGNEANGISDQVIQLSDYLVKIPIPGHAESLNAGIAAGIIMYEAVRQRIM